MKRYIILSVLGLIVAIIFCYEAHTILRTREAEYNNQLMQDSITKVKYENYLKQKYESQERLNRLDNKFDSILGKDTNATIPTQLPTIGNSNYGNSYCIAIGRNAGDNWTTESFRIAINTPSVQLEDTLSYREWYLVSKAVQATLEEDQILFNKKLDEIIKKDSIKNKPNLLHEYTTTRNILSL